MTARSQATKAHIERKMREQLQAIYVDIEDETWKHVGHAGAATGGGHFTVIVVSSRFEGLNPLDRRRLVFATLESEMLTDIHALSVRTLSPSEWDPPPPDRATTSRSP